jgi:predicted MFS family arabinose efflux permease
LNISKEKSLQSTDSQYAWFALGLLTLIYICSFVDRQIIAVLGTNIRQALGLSNMQVGVLYGPAFSLVYAVCGLFMGRMADQFSRKRIILVGLTVWSLMTLASGFASSLLFLITARFFVGVSQSALSPAVYSLLADYFKPGQRATVFSIYASGIFVGIGLSFLIGGSVAQAYDWRTALHAVAIPGFFLAAIGVFVLREPKRRYSEQQHFESRRSMPEVLQFMLRKKTVRLHLAGFSFLAMLGYTLLAFIGTVFTDVFDAPGYIASYGWFMILTGISVNASGWLADRFARKWGAEKRFWMAIVAALGGLPFYWFGLFAESVTTAFLLIGIGNVISSSYNGLAAALIQYFVKDDMRGLAGSVYLFVISIVGFGIGPPFTGWLIDHVFAGPYAASKALFSVILVCGIGAAICFYWAMKSYEEDAEIQDS